MVAVNALRQKWFVLLVPLAALVLASLGGKPRPWAEQRLEMVRTIDEYARVTSEVLGPEGLRGNVRAAMGEVPRHLFVRETERDSAYANRPLPIGYGQTISQPFIVAMMTHLLDPEPSDTVLEVGTGSGYQAAVLSDLVRHVCTIEIIPGLAETASRRLREYGYSNVETRTGDGYYGWRECGPFDGIVVTALASHIPPPLVEQLRPGASMVIPVGGPFGPQYLMLVRKGRDGRVITRQLLPVRFVPLTGGQ